MSLASFSRKFFSDTGMLMAVPFSAVDASASDTQTGYAAFSP
jgi:hypothetical protein